MTIDFDEQLKALEETQRATVNILEDFDAEREKLGHFQQATMNLLEDFGEERQKSQQIQQATSNLLEDLNAERSSLEQNQRALMNMLEDIEVERTKVEQAKALIESANKELEAFSYSVSHDLQAPLRAISGFSSAVLADCAPKLDPEGQRYLKLIQENAHNMGQLIQYLLAFSRLGRQPMKTFGIDMEKLAQEVFEELKALAPQRNVRFTVIPLPPARGDSAMIRQVFVNLLSNALKFTQPRETALIEVGLKAEGDKTAYYVKDNGVGFDMQYAGKLFGVFQRLHSVEEFEGTGVGLALVSRIITRHGGRVWAEGAVDQGACFYFTLPGGAMK